MSLWRRISASTSLFPEGEQYVVVYAFNAATTDNELNLIAYPFDSVNGFGDRLVPAEFIGDGFQGGGRVAFSPSGGGLATTSGINISGTNNFGLISYGWDEGFGAQVVSSAKPSGTDNVAFHPDGDIVFASHAEGVIYGSRIFAYNWSDATGYGTTRPTNGTVSNPTQDFVPIAVSPNGQFVALGYRYGHKLAIFPFSRTNGFGTKVEPLANPISFNPGNVVVAWNNAGTYVALAAATTDPTERLSIFAWNNASGTFGAKVANVVIEPLLTSSSVGGYALAFSPDDSAIVLAVSVAGRQLQAYSWDNDTGTFGSQFSTKSTSALAREIRFNANGNVLFASGGDAATAPAMAYQWDSETGFGTKYDDPDATGIGSGYNAYSIDYINLG